MTHSSPAHTCAKRKPKLKSLMSQLVSCLSSYVPLVSRLMSHVSIPNFATLRCFKLEDSLTG